MLQIVNNEILKARILMNIIILLMILS